MHFPHRLASTIGSAGFDPQRIGLAHMFTFLQPSQTLPQFLSLHTSGLGTQTSHRLAVPTASHFSLEAEQSPQLWLPHGSLMTPQACFPPWLADQPS